MGGYIITLSFVNIIIRHCNDMALIVTSVELKGFFLGYTIGDMDYDEQLDRALAETPDINSQSTRFEVPSPDVRQEGNVTVYENFQATVDRLNRDPDHVLRILQNELGTAAHIDESGRARLTGDFSAARVSDAIETYTDRFVLCSECGSPDTQLEEHQGTLVVRCDACGAMSSTSS